MTKWITGLCIIAALALLMFAPSCEKYVLPKLECSPDTIQVPVQGGIYEVVLTSNVKWIFDRVRIPSWISVDVPGGQSDYVEAKYHVHLTVQENPGSNARTGQITYSSATLSKKLFVEQAGSGEESPEGGEEDIDTP